MASFLRFSSLAVVIAVNTSGTRGVRMVKKRGADMRRASLSEEPTLGLDVLVEEVAPAGALTDEGMLVESAGGENASTGWEGFEVDSTLADLKRAHPEALSNLLGGISKLDFKKRISSQLKDLVVHHTVAFGQAIASSAHPVLGVVFAVFTALFTGGGDDQADFVQSILEEVKNMITEATDTFAKNLVKKELGSTLTTIENLAQFTDVNEWNGVINGDLIGRFDLIFGDCWTRKPYPPPTSSLCKDWRTSSAKGQGSALLLEVKYTELMVATILQYIEYGGKNKNFALHVQKAARRSRDHFQAFKTYRTNWTSTESGVTGGNVHCPSRGSFARFCKPEPARDHLTGSPVCEYANDLYDHRFEATFAQCVKDYKLDILENLHKLGGETLALVSASEKIVEGEWIWGWVAGQPRRRREPRRRRGL